MKRPLTGPGFAGSAAINGVLDRNHRELAPATRHEVEHLNLIGERLQQLIDETGHRRRELFLLF